MGQELKVALELQPCCGRRSGIGIYTYELARRLKDTEDMSFCGNLFNFLGRNDNSAALAGISMPLRESRAFPYGVYRRIWNIVPVPYQSLFPGEADLSVFFNYIVPPRVSGKVITSVYDMTYLRCPETMEARNRRRLQAGMEYSVERGDRIVTISAFSQREITELLGIPAGKIDVIPPAPSLSAQAADYGAVAARYGIKKPYILYVGTIEPRKNLQRLIQAFTLLKKEQGIAHQLVLAGGKGWANDAIYAEADGAEDVVFTGYITESEKYALYQNASVFVFPSLYEGFGIPPLEAMSFDCPVVCADAASLPEVVGDAAEMVRALDVTDIARGIWRVLSDEDYARQLVRRGQEQKKKFTWTAAAEKLTDVCRTVLRGS